VNQFEEIGEVLAGRKELKVGVNNETIIILAFAIFLAVFIGNLAAKAVSG